MTNNRPMIPRLITVFVCCALFFGGCASGTQPNDELDTVAEQKKADREGEKSPEIRSQTEKDEFQTIKCTVLSHERYYYDSGDFVTYVYFLLPEKWTKESIEEQAKKFGEMWHSFDKRANHFFFSYYDKECFYRTNCNTVADVDCELWNNTATVHIDVYPRNEDYALNDEELELYVAFQEAFFEIAGCYAPERFERVREYSWFDEDSVYKQVAEQLGVEEEELIDLRIKVSKYCEIPICETIMIDE